MTWSKGKWIGSGLSVAAGIGAAAAALALAGAPAGDRLPAREAPRLKASGALTARQNQRPLSEKTKSELGAWGTRLVECLEAGGFELAGLQVRKTEMVIQLPARLRRDPKKLVMKTGQCGIALGDPPDKASVTFERGAIRLYKPKVCLLPQESAG